MRSFAWSVPVILLLVILLLGLFTSLLEMKAETLIPHRGVGSEI